MTPAARREAAAHLEEVHGVSERRACQALDVDRSAVHYRSRRPDDGAIRSRLREIAAVRRRFGYRRLHILLRREGVVVNHKKLRRLYAEERIIAVLREQEAGGRPPMFAANTGSAKRRFTSGRRSSVGWRCRKPAV